MLGKGATDGLFSKVDESDRRGEGQQGNYYLRATPVQEEPFSAFSDTFSTHLSPTGMTHVMRRTHARSLPLLGGTSRTGITLLCVCVEDFFVPFSSGREVNQKNGRTRRNEAACLREEAEV